MLDTDICSYIMKRSHPVLLKKLRKVPLEEITISVITEAELLFGIRISSKTTNLIESFDEFIKHVAVIDWTRAASHHYADIRADLQRRGEMIGSNDLFIAAHARSLGATLVTNNIREFGRVRELEIGNWLSEN